MQCIIVSMEFQRQLPYCFLRERDASNTHKSSASPWKPLQYNMLTFIVNITGPSQPMIHISAANNYKSG